MPVGGQARDRRGHRRRVARLNGDACTGPLEHRLRFALDGQHDWPRAAIASNIFDGRTVLNTSDGFNVTSAMSDAARMPGTFSRGTRPVNLTLLRPWRDARSRRASSSAPSPTIRIRTSGARETQQTGGRDQRAEAVRHSNRPDVAGQDVVVTARRARRGQHRGPPPARTTARCRWEPSAALPPRSRAPAASG